MRWPRVPLGDVAEFINGVAFKTSDWSETGARIVRIQNLTDPGKPYNRTQRDVSTRHQVRAGDLLVSWSATLGVFEWDRPDVAVVNQHIFKVEPDTSVIDRRYLRHVLGGALEGMGRHLHGATMKHVNRAEFLDTRIPLPPIREQQRVAGILDTVESIRRQREHGFALCAALRASLLARLLDQPDATSEVRALGDLAEVQGGLQVTHKRDGYPLRAPYLRVANVRRGSLDLVEIKTMGVTKAELERCVLIQDDLLFVEGHGNAAEIGRAARWNGSIDECVHQNHLIRARCDPDRLEPAFGEAFVNSPVGRASLLRAAKTTSGLNTITVTDVRAVQVPLPPIKLQRAFVRSLETVDQHARWAKRHLDVLDELFASLQSLAFSGQL